MKKKTVTVTLQKKKPYSDPVLQQAFNNKTVNKAVVIKLIQNSYTPPNSKSG